MLAQDDSEFYQLVGEAITTWSGIESKIFRVFRIILHTDRQFASILFYRSPTLSTRFETLDEIIKGAFPKSSGEHDHPLVAEWKKIKDVSAPLLEFRNMLAHHQVSWKSDKISSGIQIHYNENERYRGKKPRIETIKTPDLKKHISELSILFKMATAFMQKVAKTLPAEPIQNDFRAMMGLAEPRIFRPK